MRPVRRGATHTRAGHRTGSPRLLLELFGWRRHSAGVVLLLRGAGGEVKVVDRATAGILADPLSTGVTVAAVPR